MITEVLSLAVLDEALTRTYLKAEIDGMTASMQTEALMLMNQLQKNGFMDDAQDEIGLALVDQVADSWNGRVRIVDRSMKVIRDTFSRDEGKYILADAVLSAMMAGKYTTEYDRDTHSLFFVEPITSQTEEGRIVGAVLVNVGTASMEAPIMSDRLNIHGIETVFVIILILLDVLLLRRFLRPLRTLSTAISKASDGDLSVRVDVRDYRETARISESVNRTLGQLKQLDESRQEFVSNVAHELKTPITSIRVLADSLISMGEAPVELYQEFMADISQEIDRESKIIDELLSLSRLDNNAVVLKVERTNVNEKMELILKRLKPIAGTRDIELLFESFRPVMADIDDGKLTLAVTNLVENAIKYNKDGGWVKVTLNADYQYFYIKVADSGVGIPEDAQEHVFERFYRVDKARSRATGGTGLGLSIAKGIVGLHHGEIKVYSKPGEGTTFVVRIPLHYISEEKA
ncbi:MAG: HAMP domain-containing protein [Lachnospiraceae bacterium]|nr:HAMP domain-containing protein [Lachnospiraceae bacterium]